jgi:hypothetical protein
VCRVFFCVRHGPCCAAHGTRVLPGLQAKLTYDSAFVFAEIKANVALSDQCDDSPQVVTVGMQAHSIKTHVESNAYGLSH